MSDVTRVLDAHWRAESEADPDPESLEYDERVAFWRSRAPDSHDGMYDRLLAENCAPRIAAATCWYAAGLDETTDASARTQAEIAREYDISAVTLRRWHSRIHGDVES